MGVLAATKTCELYTSVDEEYPVFFSHVISCHPNAFLSQVGRLLPTPLLSSSPPSHHLTWRLRVCLVSTLSCSAVLQQLYYLSDCNTHPARRPTPYTGRGSYHLARTSGESSLVSQSSWPITSTDQHLGDPSKFPPLHPFPQTTQYHHPRPRRTRTQNTISARGTTAPCPQAERDLY